MECHADPHHHSSQTLPICSGRRQILPHLPDTLGIDHANDRYGDALHLHRLGLRQVAQRPLAGTGSALCSLHSGLLVFGSANVVELRMQRLKWSSNAVSIPCLILSILSFVSGSSDVRCLLVVPSLMQQCIYILNTYYYIVPFHSPGLSLELVETARHHDMKHSKTVKTSPTLSAINFLTFSLQTEPIHANHRLRWNFSQLPMGQKWPEVRPFVWNKPLFGVTQFKLLKPQLTSKDCGDFASWHEQVRRWQGVLGLDLCWWSCLIYNRFWKRVWVVAPTFQPILDKPSWRLTANVEPLGMVTEMFLLSGSPVVGIESYQRPSWASTVFWHILNVFTVFQFPPFFPYAPPGSSSQCFGN